MAAMAGKLEARREDCMPVAGKSTRTVAGTPTRYKEISHDSAAIEAPFVELSSRRTPSRPRRSFSTPHRAGVGWLARRSGQKARSIRASLSPRSSQLR